jgi:hypothetical protein
MLTRFRNIAYVMAYAVATIPLWHYITDGRILALMVAVVTFAYINVVLSTVQAAQPILSSEKAKTPLPRWLPDKPKYQKWWLLVRRTLKWHLLLIPPKMGLALGFSGWFYSVYRNQGHYMLNPYFYSSNTYISSSHAPFPQLAFPQRETVLIGMTLIILFAWLELGLLSSVIISTQARFAKVMVKKTNIMLLVIALSTIFSTILWFTNPYDPYSYNAALRVNRRIEDTFLLATNSVTEQGVLLAANIMRPVGLTSSFTWQNKYLGFDNRPFVARQIVAGMLGLLLYAGATWAVLWFVDDEI